MIWIIGIVLLIVISLYFINKRNPATKNIASRYFALKEIFGNDDEISEKQYLEMAGVFSQIVYVQNGKMSIEEIRTEAENAVESENGQESALVSFCTGINSLIYDINGLDTMDAIKKAEKEIDLHEKTVKKVKQKGYSKISFSSTNDYVRQFPDCLSGEYAGLN